MFCLNLIKRKAITKFKNKAIKKSKKKSKYILIFFKLCHIAQNTKCMIFIRTFICFPKVIDFDIIYNI